MTETLRKDLPPGTVFRYLQLPHVTSCSDTRVFYIPRLDGSIPPEASKYPEARISLDSTATPYAPCTILQSPSDDDGPVFEPGGDNREWEEYHKAKRASQDDANPGPLSINSPWVLGGKLAKVGSIRPLLEELNDDELASCAQDLQAEQHRRNLRYHERVQAKEREIAKLVEHRHTLMKDVHRWYDQAVESLDKVYPDLKEKAPV